MSLAGAVLAGGKSLRFGKNKTLEVFHGKRLIDRAVDSLRSFCDPVLVAANDLSIYADVQATLVRDIFPHQGPLVGLYTALLFSPHEWLFVKAGDMPFLVPELVQLMLSTREDADAVVPLTNGMYEPLLALYSRRCIPAIAAVLEEQKRQIFTFYSKMKVRTIPEEEWRIADPHALSAKNVNTPEDWTAIESIPDGAE